jgi:hypothetical protein
MTRDELMAAMQATAAEKPRALKVAKWGTIYVRPQTVAEVDALTDTADSLNGKDKLARSAACVICNEDGTRVFDPTNEADVALLAKQPWPMLNKVLDAARKVTGEDAEGN